MHADVAVIEVVGLAALHAVPAEPLKKVLGEQDEPVVRVEDVDEAVGSSLGPARSRVGGGCRCRGGSAAYQR